MATFKEISRFCDQAMVRMDEIGDAEIQRRRSTPEARAMQAANREKMKKNAARAAARRAASSSKALAKQIVFEIGQAVRTRAGDLSEVASVSGSTVTLSNGKKFIASSLSLA